jgi:hypothetical protein
MSYKKIFTLALMVISLMACKAKTSADDVALVENKPVAPTDTAAETVVASGDASNLSAAEALEKKLTKEMPYADLRKIVLAEGWLPLVEPDCKENVGGEALICSQQPEVESCSGDGHCNMQFAHSASQTKLYVGTYADNTKSWEFSSTVTDEKTVGCPSQNFEEFLKKFASDKTVQTAFTLPLVKVEELVDDNEKGFSERSVYFNKSDYDDFNLAYVKDGFHAVFHGDVGPKPINVELKPEATDSYFVKFMYGVSEGNSYRFKNQGGCWQLAEDPEAPSP